MDSQVTSEEPTIQQIRKEPSRYGGLLLSMYDQEKLKRIAAEQFCMRQANEIRKLKGNRS